MAKYVCSDMHGQYGLFKKMLEDIHFSMEDTLFVLGDIIDRGPESIPMLQDIMARPNVFCIMGNHELMMYTEYRVAWEESYWLHGSNGGNKTKREFRRLPMGEQKKVLDFIENMYLQIDLTVGDMHFLLSHSDFLEEKGSVFFRDVDYEVARHVVWNSPWRTFEYVPESKYAEDGRVHVIGHVPVQNIFRRWTGAEAYIDAEHLIINIDLGCAGLSHGYPGGLCCLCLDKIVAGEGGKAFTYYFPEE